MNQVNNTLKNPNTVIRRTCDIVRTINSNTISFVRKEHKDDGSSIDCNSSISTQQGTDANMVGDLIEEWPSPPIDMDHIDRVELKQAVKDANNDSMNRVGVLKDGLDITLRAFRVRAPVHFSDRKIATALPEDPCWSYATSKGTNITSASSLPCERQHSLDYECVTKSLRSLCLPGDQIPIKTQNRETANKYVNSATSVLDIDHMLLR